MKSSAEATLRFTAKSHLSGEASCAAKGWQNGSTERQYGKVLFATLNNFTNSSYRNLDNVNGHLLAFKWAFSLVDLHPIYHFFTLPVHNLPCSRGPTKISIRRLPHQSGYFWNRRYLLHEYVIVFGFSRDECNTQEKLQIQLTPDNSNLALTRTKIDFPWISVIHLL